MHSYINYILTQIYRSIELIFPSKVKIKLIEKYQFLKVIKTFKSNSNENSKFFKGFLNSSIDIICLMSSLSEFQSFAASYLMDLSL